MCEPKEIHLIAVKHIMRYLQGTLNLGLKYEKVDLDLHGFTDSDWGGSVKDRKSTSRCCFSLGLAMISWICKKQSSVAQSSTEAEYIAAASCTSQVIWIQSQLRDYGLNMKKIPLYCDSESAIRICHNPVQHSKTKHIALRYHFIKDHVEDGNVEVHFVRTTDQLADVFTKALPEASFNKILQGLGMMESESVPKTTSQY